MYEFSVPMPLYKEHFDKLTSINKEVKKSRITSLYFSMPTNSIDFTGFEQDRIKWNFDTSFEFWKPLIELSLNNNFDFIYVLNSPVIHYEHQKELYVKLEKLDKLINNLRILGANKIRVCNPQLIGYLNKNYPDIELYISTSTEIKVIKEYSNLFSEFKNIKNCVPSWDVNKNFKLLNNLRIKFPYIEIELMVNEGCLPGCPFRGIHNNWSNITTDCKYSEYFYTKEFITKNCGIKIDNNLAYYFANTNVIYPWEIDEYYKFGINNFKLVGRNSPEFMSGKYFNYYKHYLNGIDDIKNILNLPIRYFNHYHLNNKSINYLIKEIKPYLTDIKHFVKHGHLCSSICGNECNYCRKSAEKIQRFFNVKEKKEMKRTISMCKI